LFPSKKTVIKIQTFEEITQILMSREIGGKPLYWVAVYLVDGLLIDTGCSYTVDELVSYLEKNPPKLAVNTHYHEDHVAANRLIQERFGITVYAHPEAVARIGKPATLFPYQELVWGYPEPSEVLPIPPVIKTEKFTFEIIECPGHSSDHIALVEAAKGWCFSGDIFAGENLKFIRPEEDMGVTVASQEKLAGLDTKRLILFTSSGRIVEDGRKALGECVRNVRALSRQAKELQALGRTVAEIVNELFGGEQPRAERTNGQFTSENLIRSVLRME
jgi:glyoxylase-like metal-dependent hydrolase (beta-lactamase superfamily II)